MSRELLLHVSKPCWSRLLLPGTQAAGLFNDAGLQGPGDGVGFAQGGMLWLWQGCAGIPRSPGRAGRAWRAGCDVKPGGGSVGPSAPIPGPAPAPVTARTINALPGSQTLLQGLQGSRSRSRDAKPRRLPGQVSAQGWTCRARVNFPALPVAVWNTWTRLPHSPGQACTPTSAPPTKPGHITSGEPHEPSLGCKRGSSL